MDLKTEFALNIDIVYILRSVVIMLVEDRIEIPCFDDSFQSCSDEERAVVNGAGEDRSIVFSKVYDILRLGGLLDVPYFYDAIIS